MPEKDTSRYPHSQAARSTSSPLSVDHDISCSSCSVVRCAKSTTGHKQLLVSYRSTSNTQSWGTSCCAERQREVTCDRAISQMLLRGSFRIPTFTGSSSGSSPFLPGTFIPATSSRWPTPATQIFRDLTNDGGLPLLQLKFQKVMRGYTMTKGPPCSLLHNLLTFSKLGPHESALSRLQSLRDTNKDKNCSKPQCGNQMSKARQSNTTIPADLAVIGSHQD